MNRLIIIILGFVILSVYFSPRANAQSKNGYKITVKANTYADSLCYLGYYYGKFRYAKDTAVFNNKGIAVFEKKETQLERGVYFVILPGRKFFDIIINKEQHFSIQLDTANLIRSLNYSGSKENTWFAEYNRNMEEQGSRMTRLRDLEKVYKDSTHDSLTIIQSEIKEVNAKMIEEKESFIKKYPDSFVSKIFLIGKDPEFPKPPLKNDGSVDSLQLFYLYRDNYWMNSDFTDEAIVRTPVFHNRLERFFTSVIVQHPDTIIKEIDKLISQVDSSSDLFKYIVWYLTFHFETSQIMGHDAVFVEMVEKYYKTDMAFWVSETQKKRIIERGDKLKPILIGKTAPNMALMDTTFKSYIPLHAIQSPYTLLLFWDPNCGHCKREILKVKELYEERKFDYGITVYSVCADTSLTKWKQSIYEKGIENWVNVNATRSALGHYQELYDVHSTPMIFVLDEKKTIIAKRIGAEGSFDFIKTHRARKNEDD
jgi:thiol-disulfide isomerase/thioredoxin